MLFIIWLSKSNQYIMGGGIWFLNALNQNGIEVTGPSIQRAVRWQPEGQLAVDLVIS